MKFISKERLAKQRDKVAIPGNLRLREHVREMRANGEMVYEFVGSDTFGDEWNQRRRYEVDAGRDMEPLLYPAIYSEIRDANLPEVVPVYRIGPGGVVFEEVLEGGEVKFASVTSSEFSVRIRHYGVGLEYSKDLMVFNQLWRVPIVERQAGIAYNALLNHIHFNPILTASYGAANQTAANSSGSTTVEDHLLTIEDAITNSRADTSNPRRGPYALLVSSADELVIQKALTREVQQGLASQSRAIDSIQTVIAYDGWTGTRGSKSTTYSGVSSGTAYLVNLGYRDQDFQSYMKQDLMQDGQDEDITRFLMKIVWDTYFGAYANPTAAVEEVTLP
ncbi:hypothetical protein KC887_09690 [Candidatus Kaiserbacteria bacterium]|nr:hypothetical protein [Candidatus Kaiserbacteria bacterium]